MQKLNRLGLCIDYDDLERINIDLAQRTIETAGENCVPVSTVIQNSVLIHDAMENFGNEGNSPSAIGGRHDTNLILFRYNNEEAISKKEISKISPSFVLSNRSLDSILDCHNLLKQGKFSGRGEITTDFQPQKSNTD